MYGAKHILRSTFPILSRVLLATLPYSSNQPSRNDILDDSTFGFVKPFIAALANECD